MKNPYDHIHDKEDIVTAFNRLSRDLRTVLYMKWDKEKNNLTWLQFYKKHMYEIIDKYETNT